MTDTEKALLQAQHRLEEAQARNRVKERKARTRRLIQTGAILEKVLPEVRTMEPQTLEDYLEYSERNKAFRRSPGNRGPFSFPEGRTYSPPRRRKVRLPPFPPLAKTAATPLLLLSPQSRLCGAPFPAVVLLRISRALSEGNFAFCGKRQTMPQHLLCCCHCLRSCLCRIELAVQTAACENLPPAALSQRWTAHPHRPFSLSRKRNRKGNEVRRSGNLPFRGKGCQPWGWPFRCRSGGLFELFPDLQRL